MEEKGDFLRSLIRWFMALQLQGPRECTLEQLGSFSDIKTEITNAYAKNGTTCEAINK
jgi:hypothetical protein